MNCLSLTIWQKLLCFVLGGRAIYTTLSQWWPQIHSVVTQKKSSGFPGCLWWFENKDNGIIITARHRSLIPLLGHLYCGLLVAHLTPEVAKISQFFGSEYPPTSDSGRAVRLLTFWGAFTVIRQFHQDSVKSYAKAKITLTLLQNFFFIAYHKGDDLCYFPEISVAT